MKLEFENEFKVGIKIIDSQHKKLINLINTLNNAIQTLQTKEKLNKIFLELKKYSLYHFATEEKYFKEFKYKKAEEHIKEHKFFKKKINELSNYLKKKNDLELAFELMDFLEDWLINHLLMKDKEYVKCFKDNGLK